MGICFHFSHVGLFFCFLCTGDVVVRGASDHTINSRLSVKEGGYVSHFYSSANHFKNDLISAVDQKSYNG